MCEKKIKRKNMKNIRRTLRHVSPWWLGRIHWNLEWNVSYPEEISKANIVQVLLNYRCVKTALSWFLYNTHLSVCVRTGCTCPHDTLSCVLIIISYSTIRQMLTSWGELEWGYKLHKNIAFSIFHSWGMLCFYYFVGVTNFF